MALKAGRYGVRFEDVDEYGKIRNIDNIPSGDSFKATHIYSKNDIVIYDNNLYTSLVNNNIGNIPNSSSVYWTLTSLSEVLNKAISVIFTSITDGDVWVSTVPNVTRNDKICDLQMAYQIKAGTYTGYNTQGTGTRLGKLPFIPVVNFNFLVQVGSDLKSMRCSNDGYLYFNNNITLTSNTWVTGQCTYITDDEEV